MWAEGGIDEERAGSFVQTNVWTRMLCHFVCNWDWLSVWAWRFEFLVTKIDCVQLCSWKCAGVCPALHVWSSQLHTDTQFWRCLIPWPHYMLPESQTQYFIYSVSLPPPLSLLVTLPLSNTYSTPSLYFNCFFFHSSDLSVERERHLVFFWKTDSKRNRFVFGYILHPAIFMSLNLEIMCIRKMWLLIYLKINIQMPLHLINYV